MNEKLICKNCKESFQISEYHISSRRCCLCRKKQERLRKKELKGTELAENLLLNSCQSVFERVRGKDRAAYQGVKCSWSMPNEMKTDLMANQVFWEAWKRQSGKYERMGRLLSYRPTIDRIESRVEKNGHYYPENITMLSYSENAAKASSTKCLIIIIKGMSIIQFTNFESIDKVMKVLNIHSRNVLNVKRDSGKIFEIGNGYSVLIQTVSGMLEKCDKPMYKIVVERKIIIVDYLIGKKYVLKRPQTCYLNYGIWFNDTSMMIR